MIVVAPRESLLERRTVARLRSACPVVRVLKLNLAGNRGWPDRLLLFPGGRAVFVEFKRRGEALRRLQAERARELLALGFDTFMVADDADADRLLAHVVDPVITGAPR